jgi:hypothetical protein
MENIRLVAIRGKGRKIHGIYTDRKYGAITSTQCSSNGGRTQIQGCIMAEGEKAKTLITCEKCRAFLKI